MTREEAIKWVDDRMCLGRGTFTKNHPPNIDECWEAGCMAIKALKSDRPTGEWVFDTQIPIGKGAYSAGYRCSICGKDYFHVDGMNFCPNCGADMRGEEDDESRGC